jgi:RNA-binding protein NOB1
MSLPFQLNFMEPDQRDIKFVIEFSKKTGNFQSLSVVDIKLLALVCFLQRTHVNSDHESAEPAEGTVVSTGRTKGSYPIGFTKVISKNEKDDDEGGWITPTNLAEMMASKMKELEVEDPLEVPIVALMTVDFAMQNVIFQLGLKLVSVDERVIRKTNKIILRCHACFKTTPDLSKVFCPNCGNLKTLKQVAVSVDETGKQVIRINMKKPLKIRGTKYNIPLPKGGQHSRDPVLVEDQRMPQNKPKAAAAKEKRLLKETVLDDPVYLLRNNPFARHDVYSRAARCNNVLERRSNLIPTGNPNVVRPSAGNRKKEKRSGFL